MIGCADVTQDVRVCQIRQHLIRTDSIAESFPVMERQFISGAFEVVQQDIKIVGIQQRILGTGSEKVFRMCDDELVQRG